MLGTAAKLAELRCTTPEHIAQITTANFERLIPRLGGLH
jgi:Tat protein secretion system quality control protein TatD with DNase activity